MQNALGACVRFCFAALLLLATRSSFAQVPDPGVPGPRPVTRAEYDFGDSVFEFSGCPTPGSCPVEMRADVHYPTDLTDGPFPIVVFLHGWHLSCYNPSTLQFFLQWPCSAGRQPIPNYVGYDYVGSILASYGYIVVSISANGVNSRDTTQTDIGMLWRAKLIQEHLNQWVTWATVGGDPFGTTFVGKVDFTRVGTMGHSRGGEGVSRHYTYNREQGSPYGVLAVLPLAPVDFSREIMDNVNLMVLLPYCDGDVADLQGVHYYDDSRFITGDPTNKHTMLVMGGNHSYYNTIWTPAQDDPEGLATFPTATWDDWHEFEDGNRADPWCGTTQPGNHKLAPPGSRGTLKAYLTAFFRTYLGAESVFLPLLKGDAPPPPSATTNEIVMSYHAKNLSTARLDVNRTLTTDSLTVDELGGPVSQNGLSPYNTCGGDGFPLPAHCLPAPQPASRQPHTTPSARSSMRGMRQVRFGWDGVTAIYENDLTAGTNVSGYAMLQVRVGVNWFDPRNPAGATQDFSISLTDGAGNTATIDVAPYSAALFYPGGEQGQLISGPSANPPLTLHYAAVPRLLLNTMRVPLSMFTGIDLTDVRSVVFAFNQTGMGALNITDLMFSD